MHLTDTWFAIEGAVDDKPYLIRGREDVISFQRRGKHNLRIDIIFHYVTDDIKGMPDLPQLSLMEQVEDALVYELEQDIQGILAFVYTGNDHRVWYWYCKDVMDTSERINKALSSFPERLPLQMHSVEDPEWTAYNEILD